MSINTVCMTLVASRNLTTLFASLCMLHPEIQVLNHFPSINSDPETNFLVSYTNEKLSNFVRKVDQINRDSLKIPGEGGVITKAHAFKSDEDMRQTFANRFKDEIKPGSKSIVWKDSPRNTLLLQKCNLDELFTHTSKLRFILTVRNPMDCATSSSTPGYNKMYKDPSKEGVLNELFERYQWFFAAEKKYPEYFMSFFEFDPNDAMLDKLQPFLMVKNDNQWKNDFMKLWVMKSTYDHSAEFKKQYSSLIDSIDNKDLRDKFRKYL